MYAEWIGPKGIVVFGVADGDVARDTFDVAFARPVTESGGHVVELPFALGGEGGEGGYS